MTVIAQRGRTSFLLDVGDAHARILDIEHEPTLFPRALADSILSRGDWEEFHGAEDPILELASRVEREGEQIPSEGWDSEPRYTLRGVRVAPEDAGIEQVRILVSIGTVEIVGAPAGNSRASLEDERSGSIWTRETELAR